jgi:hypothetical protein
MRKLLFLVGPLACLAVLTVPLQASAAEVHVPFCGINFNGPPPFVGIPNCSWTETTQGVVNVQDNNANPCSGVLGTFTSTTNTIFHVTVNGAGDIWATETATAHFTFVPNAAGPPSYRGEMTFWFGASLNSMNFVLHDIGNIVAHGSDGSQITLHFVDHLSFNANGVVNSFSIFSATCP